MHTVCELIDRMSAPTPDDADMDAAVEAWHTAAEAHTVPTSDIGTIILRAVALDRFFAKVDDTLSGDTDRAIAVRIIRDLAAIHRQNSI